MDRVRRLLAAIASLTALAALLPVAATAAVGGASAASAGPIAVIVPAVSATVAPPGFSSNADEAMRASEATAAMQALHRHDHPLFVQAFVWTGTPRSWFIDFSYRGKRVAEVVVTPAGSVTSVWTGPLATAIYARGNFAPLFSSLWVLLPFSALFLLPFLDLRRPWRLLHLDALVLLSFFVSYWLFERTHLEAAVWMVYPPLIYLLRRMLRIGGRGTSGEGGLPPLLSLRVLGAGLVLLLCARIALGLASREVVDVGYASVLGAHYIAHGHPLYYASAAHFDTYGPIAYLAYLPFELAFPWHGSWNYVPAAHAASLVFDVLTILGLVLLGRQIWPGREGTRLGLALAWAWAACPFSLLALMMHSNDGLIAMLSVWSLVAFTSPGRRGVLLGLAAAAKFSPAALLPLYARDRDRGGRGTLATIAAFVLVVAISIGLYLPSGGLTEFYNHTIGYQLTRSDVFSPWALHPSLDPIKLGLEFGALLLALLVAFIPRPRSLPQVAALAGAVTIAVQLPAIHWFYYYIVWFLPFVLVALLGRTAAMPQFVDASDVATATRSLRGPVDDREPALA